MAEETFVDKYLLPKEKEVVIALLSNGGKKTGFSKFSPLHKVLTPINADAEEKLVNYKSSKNDVDKKEFGK